MKDSITRADAQASYKTFHDGKQPSAKGSFFFFLLLVITCLHLHFSHAPTSTTFPANRVTEISFAPSLLKFQNYNNNNNLRRKLSVARAMHLLLEWCSSCSWGKWRDQCVKPRLGLTNKSLLT